MYNSDDEPSHSIACLLNGGTQELGSHLVGFLSQKRAEETDDPDEIMARHFDEV